jgi:hypothetical protein
MADLVTQVAVEVLVAPSTTNARVTQDAVEVLVAPSTTAARVTQVAVEVLNIPPPPNARVTQAAVEVLASPSTVAARVTQAAIEVLYGLQQTRTGSFTLNATIGPTPPPVFISPVPVWDAEVYGEPVYTDALIDPEVYGEQPLVETGRLASSSTRSSSGRGPVRSAWTPASSWSPRHLARSPQRCHLPPPVSGSFPVNAAKLRAITGAFTVNAVKVAPRAGSPPSMPTPTT